MSGSLNARPGAPVEDLHQLKALGLSLVHVYRVLQELRVASLVTLANRRLTNHERPSSNSSPSSTQLTYAFTKSLHSAPTAADDYYAAHTKVGAESLCGGCGVGGWS